MAADIAASSVATYMLGILIRIVLWNKFGTSLDFFSPHGKLKKLPNAFIYENQTMQMNHPI